MSSILRKLVKNVKNDDGKVKECPDNFEDMAPECDENTVNNADNANASQTESQKTSDDQEPRDSEQTEDTPKGEESKTGGANDPGAVDLSKVLLKLKGDFEREQAIGKEYLRRLQQLQAEYDNFRKRSQREKEELAKYASEKLIKELLPVLDNLERGLTASQASKDFEGLAKGVEMILRQLTGVLTKEGLSVIETVGQEFDPALHEAVMHVDASGQEANIVIEELQKGYYLKDKVLRPSMVKVTT